MRYCKNPEVIWLRGFLLPEEKQQILICETVYIISKKVYIIG